MIGMNFWTFLVLAVTSLVAATIVHYVIRYRFLEGFDGFLGKVIVAWMGGWLGSPVIGHWFESVKVANVYLIPALLGAFAGAFAAVASEKALAQVFASRVNLGADVRGIRKDVAA